MGQMPVYGYCRVSTDRQANEGESLGVQERQLQGYTAMQGMKLDRVFVERGVSGSIPLADRPQGAAMLAVLQSGDVVVSPKLDRVFRSALDALQRTEALRERGVSLHLLDLGGDIAGNGLSRLFMTIAAAFAELERDRIRERITQVKRDQKARGRFPGGTRAPVRVLRRRRRRSRARRGRASCNRPREAHARPREEPAVHRRQACARRTQDQSGERAADAGARLLIAAGRTDRSLVPVELTGV
jgi:DNA invertase Pin-like site-specific DNA recombinase